MERLQTQKYIQSISIIESLYDFLNEKYFESALSKPVITIQADESYKKLGWFVPCRIWKDEQGYREFEINITANFLDCTIEEAAGVLLHEMCHQYCYEHHIKDTSRGGQYHNKEFVAVAQAHGLIYAGETKGDGYTVLSSEAISILASFNCDRSLLYRKLTKEDVDELIWHEALCRMKKNGYPDIENTDFKGDLDKETEDALRKAIATAKEKFVKSFARRKSSTRKYICEKCKQSVRATKEVNIICGICHVPMVVANKEQDEATDINLLESHRESIDLSSERLIAPKDS